MVGTTPDARLMREAMGRFASGVTIVTTLTAEWSPGYDGIPLLDGAIVHAQCRRWNVLDGGDHAIVIGHATGIATAPGKPLLYAGGAYLDPPTGCG